MKNIKDELQIDNLIYKLKNNIPCHSKFLDEVKFNKIKKILDKEKINYEVYRFNNYFEKVIIHNKQDTSFVSCISIKYQKRIRHQDILGLLFNLGLEHDFFSDIFVEENKAYFLIFSNLKNLVLNVKKIANVKVEMIEVDQFILEEEHFDNFQIIIPSFRVDVILSKLLNVSRNKSLDLILNKKVMVNYIEVDSKKYQVNLLDIISVRGYGKYKIIDILAKSKKDNYFVKVIKYR